jgi:2-polyprenyl-6-methoxyphenol hydroxylase-like FAD-dependent oxidoreductase
VRLITRPPISRGLAVALPPSCAKLFDAIGISEAIERTGFLRSTGNTVWWGGGEARVEPFPRGTLGWQVDIDALADVILTEAVAAGVRVEHGHISEPPGGYVLDCTGRSGVIARTAKVRRFDDGPRTIALVGVWWRDGGWPVPDDTHTLIESYGDGWMWSVPSAPGLRHIAAMIDPQRSNLARGGTSAAVYRAEIAKTRVFSKLVDGASMIEGPCGFDASQYRATEYAGKRWLLVGDAGSFIDPLSSAGVKKALASSWLAAVAVHTALTHRFMRRDAFRFFAAREQEIEQHLARESRQFLASASAGHHYPFWDERSGEVEERTIENATVRRALHELRARETWQPRLGAAVTVKRRPFIRGHEIVREPHLVSAEYPRGIRYIRAIDMVALVRFAPATRHVPDLYEMYVQRLGPVPLPDFLFAVATAVARGWLVAE